MNFLLIIIPAILIIVSQAYIKCSYNKYREFSVKSGKSGYETAREILDSNGLSDVRIVKIGGELTDNFNPKTNTISLSSDIYVAAHECGHVIQHKEKYAFIVLRSILVPIVSISSKLGYVIMIIGVLASIFDMAMIGFIMMCAALLFQLVTLPTEFNASSRAKKQLIKLNIIDESELNQVNVMLNSAAMTYVASFFASFTQMLRLFLQIRRDD